MICFLSLLIALVSAAKSQQYEGPANTLYFREFSMTGGARPTPQLVCKDNEHVHRCAQVHIRAVECTRNAAQTPLEQAEDEGAVEWRCKSHENEPRISWNFRVHFAKLDIKCEDALDAATCSLHYTFLPDAYTQNQIAAQKCFDECSPVIYIPSSPTIVLVSFILGLALVHLIMAVGGIVAYSRGLVAHKSRFARIMAILMESGADAAEDEENGKVEKKN